jgi:type I restriction enzyme S subunit
MTTKRKTPQIRFNGFNEEWQENNLGHKVEFFTGLTYSPNNVIKERGTLVLRSSNVKNGKIVDADNVYVNSNVVNCDNVQKGDIAVVVRNGSRSLIGKHAQIQVEMNNTVIGAFMTGVRSEQPSYINALLDTHKFNNEIAKNLGATINQITTGAFKRMIFSFPEITEQNKIGNYFQHLDKLIEQKEKKYQKLKQFNKAMLDKMFPKNGATAPEIRFKGFSGEWEKKKLGDIGETYTGLSGKTKEDFGHGEGRFVTYMNVFSNSIAFQNVTEPIEIDEKQNAVKMGDVFFTTSSETPEEVGMSSVWMSNISNVYLNSFCFGYRPKKVFDNYYLAYMLRSVFFRKKITFLAQGISRYNISKNKVMEISVYVPDIEEQIKIGDYFKQLDSLVDLHHQELKKLKNIKKASLEKMFV